MLPGGNKTVKRERSEDRAYAVADASELPALRSGTGCSLLAVCVRPSVWCDRDLHDPFTRGCLRLPFSRRDLIHGVREGRGNCRGHRGQGSWRPVRRWRGVVLDCGGCPPAQGRAEGPTAHIGQGSGVRGQGLETCAAVAGRGFGGGALRGVSPRTREGRRPDRPYRALAPGGACGAATASPEPP